MRVFSAAICLVLLGSTLGVGQQENRASSLFRELTDVTTEFRVKCPGSVQCQLHVYRLSDPESSRFKLTFVIFRLNPPFRLRVGEPRRKRQRIRTVRACSRCQRCGGFGGSKLLWV